MLLPEPAAFNRRKLTAHNFACLRRELPLGPPCSRPGAEGTPDLEVRELTRLHKPAERVHTAMQVVGTLKNGQQPLVCDGYRHSSEIELLTAFPTLYSTARVPTGSTPG